MACHNFDAGDTKSLLNEWMEWRTDEDVSKAGWTVHPVREKDIVGHESVVKEACVAMFNVKYVNGICVDGGLDIPIYFELYKHNMAMRLSFDAPGNDGWSRASNGRDILGEFMEDKSHIMFHIAHSAKFDPNSGRVVAAYEYSGDWYDIVKMNISSLFSNKEGAVIASG